jgi:hypothetical protein
MLFLSEKIFVRYPTPPNKVRNSQNTWSKPNAMEHNESVLEVIEKLKKMPLLHSPLTSGKRFFRILVQKQKICFWSWE